MNTKKLLLTTIIIFVLLEVLNYIVHRVILASAYEMQEAAFRPEAEMNSMMWIVFVTDLIWSFFFVFFFAKGYEGKGIMEGVRFGFYIGLFWGLVSAYQTYVFAPITYSLAFQWFIFGMIVSIILGVVASLVYKPEAATQTETVPA